MTTTAPGRICESFAADGVLMLELKVLFHLQGGEVMATLVVSLGEGEDDEKGGGEDNATYCCYGFCQQIDNCCREQDKKDGEKAERDLRSCRS